MTIDGQEKRTDRSSQVALGTSWTSVSRSIAATLLADESPEDIHVELPVVVGHQPYITGDHGGRPTNGDRAVRRRGDVERNSCSQVGGIVT